MDNVASRKFDLYKDIGDRTGGEIYVGVIGPVRTGKSTFIKRIMDLLVLPNILEGPEKNRIKDELPQSGSGKTITTTEPKFLPKDAFELKLSEDVQMKFRLIDCVGYLVDGVVGHLEENQPRKAAKMRTKVTLNGRFENKLKKFQLFSKNLLTREEVYDKIIRLHTRST